jgi:hypothetical protein
VDECVGLLPAALLLDEYGTRRPVPPNRREDHRQGSALRARRGILRACRQTIARCSFRTAGRSGTAARARYRIGGAHAARRHSGFLCARSHCRRSCVRGWSSWHPHAQALHPGSLVPMCASLRRFPMVGYFPQRSAGSKQTNAAPSCPVPVDAGTASLRIVMKVSAGGEDA